MITRVSFAIAALVPAGLVTAGNWALHGWAWGLITLGLMTQLLDLCNTRDSEK